MNRWVLCLLVLLSCIKHRVEPPPPRVDATVTDRSSPTDADATAAVEPDDDLMPFVLAEYTKILAPGSVRAWKQAFRRCTVVVRGHRRFLPSIGEASRITNFPAAFIAGIIMHESRCRMGDRDWAGGIGFMQITPPRGHGPDPRFLRRARTWAGGRTLNWRTNELDNILLGLAEIAVDDAAFPDDLHSLAAYNAGIGGVRRAVRRVGWTDGGLPPFTLTMRNLPHRRGLHGMDAMHYVPKVLAMIVFADRLRHHRALGAVDESLLLEEIPGAMGR